MAASTTERRRPRRGTRAHRPASTSSWLRLTALVFAPVAAAATLYIGRIHLVWLVSAYGALSLARVTAQALMAARVRRRRPALLGRPMVSIVVATLNPDPDRFDDVLASLASQNWPNLEIIVVDDGSDEPHLVRRTAEHFGARHVYQPNAGKRHAMHRAFGMLHPASRYVLTGDDDTVWHPDATADLVAALQQNRVGATTGHVATLNPHDTWLTRVTAIRYWVAFQIERAAQSFYGAVTCVSGPLGGYRRYLIEAVADDFVNQRFLGRPCTFGDDRHLTNLVLARGYRVTYCQAQAWTEVPGHMGKYLKQQKRWGKSHWREMIWTFRALPLHSPMLAADWALTLLLPFLLIASMAWYAWSAAVDSPVYLAGFAAMVVAMSIVRAVPAVAATRDPSFLWWMPFFSLFHLFVLLPLKFISLATVADGSWGTRAAATAPAAPLYELHDAVTEQLPRIPAQRIKAASDVG